MKGTEMNKLIDPQNIDQNENEFDSNIDITSLGQAMDTTWGRSSTRNSASYSVKFTLSGGCFVASYAAIVNFATERDMIDMKRRYAEESKSIINSALKVVKDTYKDLCGKTLKSKELCSSDSVEVISNSSNNPKRTAYYRSKIVFNISG